MHSTGLDFLILIYNNLDKTIAFLSVKKVNVLSLNIAFSN